MRYNFYSRVDVRDKYISFGSFYNIEKGLDKGYRNDFHIINRNIWNNEIDITNRKPDILFIMMNPGSSKPIRENLPYISNENLAYSLIKNNFVEAVPDNTQDQIMWNTGAQHCRVINISDIREGSSKKIYPLIRNINDTHSIFSSIRVEELDMVFKNLDSDTFIFKAWGVTNNLSFRKLVNQCLIKLPKGVKIIGLEKGNDEHLCYHPYSLNSKTLFRWFNKAMELIQNEVPSEWFDMLKNKYSNLI